MSIKKDILAKKFSSEASVSHDTHTDVAIADQTNQDLIKSILRAVSHAGEEDREAKAEKDQLPPTHTVEHADEVDGNSGMEEKTSGKEMFIKVISKVVLNGNNPPEQLGKRISLPTPTEKVKETVDEEVCI